MTEQPQPSLNPHQQQKTQSNGVAAVLTVLIPGLGHIYRGQTGKGLIWMLVVILAYVPLVLPGLILHIYCIFKAAKLGNEVSRTNGQPMVGSTSNVGQPPKSRLVFSLVGGVIALGLAIGVGRKIYISMAAKSAGVAPIKISAPQKPASKKK